MRPLLLLLAAVPVCVAQPRIDNVLEKMVPPGTTALIGAQMDQVKQSPLYKKLLAAQRLPGLEDFSAQTGFDPRRDVREVLFAATPQGPVVLARGAFQINEAALSGAKKIRHEDYTIHAQNGGQGFCILDATLAAAGQIEAVEAALDEWKSGSHSAAQPLLARAQSINPHSAIWGVSTGSAEFLADHLPANNSGLDFSRMLRGLTDTSFEADLSTGLHAEVHGAASSVKDAMNLRDVIRGLVGLGRLRVPDNQPDLLRIWDGISVDQQDRSITIRVDIPQDLVDRLIQLLGQSKLA